MMFDTTMCHICHTKYKCDDDCYCRNCGNKRITENHCKNCGLSCDLDDLFCHHCGSETEVYDLVAR